jgi:hypothetical protein
MTNNILRLRDAIVRDSEEGRFRDTITKDSGKIRDSLNRSGEYRVGTPKGTVVIRSVKKSA